MKKLLFILAIAISIGIVKGQIPNNTWRDHLSYSAGWRLAITPNKVFCAMYGGGMLEYDKTTNEVQRWTTVQGLSDVGISTLIYHPDFQKLLIAYENGNIDVLGEKVKNLADIKRKDITGSKAINEACIYENYAYLACDFGIVVYDFEKEEIKDSYLFGPGGTAIITNDVVVYEGSIWVATDQGIYRASLSSSNLVDYTQWQKMGYPDPQAKYTQLEVFNDMLFIAYYDQNAKEDYVFRVKQNKWDYMKGIDNRIFKITAYGDNIAFTGYRTFFFNGQLEKVTQYYELFGSQGIMDTDGTIYSAGQSAGFAKRTTPDEPFTFSQNAPIKQEVGQARAVNDQIWITTGGDANLYSSGGAYRFQDEKWTSFSSLNNDSLAGIGNTSKVAIDPRNDKHVIVGTIDFGIIEILDDKVVNVYTRQTTPIFSNFAFGPRVVGLDYDQKGNCWLLFNQMVQPLYVIRANGEWEHIITSNRLFDDANHYKDLKVTSSGQIWIAAFSKGILVLEETSEGSFDNVAFQMINQDGKTLNRAYDIAEDSDGDIWIGTNSGPIIYSNTYNIFNDENITGHQVKLSRNDGTEYADYLLNGEAVLDICVDGGDQKWMATPNSGVFLVSDDGRETLHNFNTENSPMFANDVLGVEVLPSTGEVFISTIKGLISFMGRSTQASDSYSDVYVYPNPVRPDYTGDITIAGLVEDTNVKITDLSGNLVWETTSLGGQAVWDGRNFDGRRVATGVYLVYLSTPDGSQSHVTKLMFIH